MWGVCEGCYKRIEAGTESCPILPPEGVLFRENRKYCPYIDEPKTEEIKQKKRVGQQKGKGKK